MAHKTVIKCIDRLMKVLFDEKPDGYCETCGKPFTRTTSDEHKNPPTKRFCSRKCIIKSISKDKINEYHRKYYSKNKEKILARNKEYSDKPENKEKMKVYNREYYKKNPEKCREWSRKAYLKRKLKKANESIKNNN